MLLSLLVRLKFLNLIVQVFLRLSLPWQTNNILHFHLTQLTLLVWTYRVLLNKSVFVLLHLLCEVVVSNHFSCFNLSLCFEWLHHLLRFCFFVLNLVSDLLLEAGLQQICELAHCFVKHGQQLVGLEVKVRLQTIDCLVLQTNANKERSLNRW